MPSRTEVEHILRRTEFFARPSRVDALVGLPSRAAVVADILNVPAQPSPLAMGPGDDWHKVLFMTHEWIDRMASLSPRPIQEKMALFWHGHFCSDFPKVASAEAMRVQIDGFRSNGLGNLVELTKSMSTQVAMLRYLDNNRNIRTSPNENFGRELMELFTIGIGNYTEADVQAITAAWTGHTDDAATHTYRWQPSSHDSTRRVLLGHPTCLSGDGSVHGFETIDIIFGAGTIPPTATVVANRNRPSKEVAAEFMSRKFWRFFAGTEPSATVLTAMRNAALANGFEIKPWLTAMFLHDEFYSTATRQGLVRSPVDYVVALLVATGLPSRDNSPTWLMSTMGQLLFYPPDVSGWKSNRYWLNPAAMSGRTEAARHFAWRSFRGYWQPGGQITLAAGAITMQDMGTYYLNRPAELVDRVALLLGLTLTPTTRSALIDFTTRSPWPERNDVVALALMSPEFQQA